MQVVASSDFVASNTKSLFIKLQVVSNAAFTNGSSPFSVGAIYINLNALVLCKCLKYSFIANRPVFTLSKYRDLRCTKLQQSVAVLTRAFVNV